MPQLYIFLASLAAIAVLVVRRNILFARARQAQFQQDVSQRVKELQQERQKEAVEERFREMHIKEQEKKKFDTSQFKSVLRQAEVAMAHEQWTEAKRLLIQSLTLTHDEGAVSLKLASVYLESGDLKRAEQLYRRLAEIDPQNPEIHENMGRIYAKWKRYREAVASTVQAVEINPGNDRALLSLGRLYALLLRPSLAAECFRRVAELKPRDIATLFLLAESCRDAEDYENALFAYERILTLEPYNEKAREGAQDVRIKMNDLEKALS